MASPTAASRDFQKTQVTVLTLISSIFFARGLLRSNCFQSVGKVTLGSIPRWQDLLRWESKSKKVPKPVQFGTRSVVMLKYRNTNEDLTILLEQLKVMMPMVKDESLVKIHICLFDANELDPKHMMEHFTIKIRHEPTGVSTVSVSWAGCGMADGGKPGSIENLLERLAPIQGRVYAGIWHQAEASSEGQQDSQFHLGAADDVLAGKPGYVCEKDCVSIDILPTAESPRRRALMASASRQPDQTDTWLKSQPDPAPKHPGDIPDFPSNFDELAEKRWQ
ncbi:hypothetical protein RB595_002033 [Gaeumannomyces hyphopodioides]